MRSRSCTERLSTCYTNGVLQGTLIDRCDWVVMMLMHSLLRNRSISMGMLGGLASQLLHYGAVSEEGVSWHGCPVLGCQTASSAVAMLFPHCSGSAGLCTDHQTWSCVPRVSLKQTLVNGESRSPWQPMAWGKPGLCTRQKAF